MASNFQDICKDAAVRLTASSFNARFFALMKSLAQMYIGEVKAAEGCCGGAGMPETVGPRLAGVKTTRAILKRKPAGIEGKGKRKYKKSRGKNVPISGQPLKSGKAKAPGRLTLLQQCAQKSSRGRKAEWLVHRVLCHARFV
jgi:hypothetical protein